MCQADGNMLAKITVKKEVADAGVSCVGDLRYFSGRYFFEIALVVVGGGGIFSVCKMSHQRSPRTSGVKCIFRISSRMAISAQVVFLSNSWRRINSFKFSASILFPVASAGSSNPCLALINPAECFIASVTSSIFAIDGRSYLIRRRGRLIIRCTLAKSSKVAFGGR